MRERPRLRADVETWVVDDDKLFIVDGDRQSLIEGRVGPALAPRLDGTRTSAELLAELPALPIGQVLGTLARLEGIGQVVEGPPTEDPARTALWDRLGRDPRRADRALAGAQLRLLDCAGGAVDAGARAAFAAAGITHREEAALDVVLTDDYLDPALEGVNRAHVQARRPWVLARLTRTELWLGPYLHPNGPCWACLAFRMEGNRQLHRYVRAKHGRRVAGGTGPALPATLAAGAGLLAGELQMLLATGEANQIADAILTLDTVTFESARHPVIRQPRCPVCGTPRAAGSPRVELQPRPKRWIDEGGHRHNRPEATLARLSKHISPLTGAISSVRSQNTEDNGVTYSYASGHNFALMQDSTYFLRKNLRGRSGGKGRTDLQARVGAICEAIERYDGVWRGDEPTRRATYAELGPSAIHPEELLLFSDRQYAEREEWNAGQVASYHIVPERLDPERPIAWTEAWSLTHERARPVPAAYCWYGHPDLLESFFCAADANGSAAGNTLEEAVLQGLMELIERDSVALWWYNRARRPAFDLDSLEDPYVDVVRRHYRTLDRELWMLDLTSDLGIPAFSAVSYRYGGPVQDILMGFGAHLDARTAAMRALTELNQFLPAVCERLPDGRTRYWMDDPDAVAWWQTARLDSEPYVLADEAQPARRLEDYPALVSDDIAQDVRACVARLGDAGHEVLVLDQTRPEIELAVVKVMAPGLRHFWRRLGPGRLYEVPPRLGWIPRPLDEAELNPNSIFF
jgi:bacteriocin biosynthesis cyclodehydratase domain-containing protein